MGTATRCELLKELGHRPPLRVNARSPPNLPHRVRRNRHHLQRRHIPQPPLPLVALVDFELRTEIGIAAEPLASIQTFKVDRARFGWVEALPTLDLQHAPTLLGRTGDRGIGQADVVLLSLFVGPFHIAALKEARDHQAEGENGATGKSLQECWDGKGDGHSTNLRGEGRLSSLDSREWPAAQSIRPSSDPRLSPRKSRQDGGAPSDGVTLTHRTYAIRCIVVEFR